MILLVTNTDTSPQVHYSPRSLPPPLTSAAIYSCLLWRKEGGEGEKTLVVNSIPEFNLHPPFYLTTSQSSGGGSEFYRTLLWIAFLKRRFSLLHSSILCHLRITIKLGLCRRKLVNDFCSYQSPESLEFHCCLINIQETRFGFNSFPSTSKWVTSRDDLHNLPIQGKCARTN